MFFRISRFCVLTKRKTVEMPSFFVVKNKNNLVFYVSSIHLLLLKQKYEIFAVDCTQIKDLNNLCVRPTIACKQAKLGLDSLNSATLRFGRNDV